jgi:hypothetical protein
MTNVFVASPVRILLIIIPLSLSISLLPWPKTFVQIVGQYGVFASFLFITAIDQPLPWDQKLLVTIYTSISYSFFGYYGFFLSIFSFWPWKFRKFLETDDESEFMNYLTQFFTSTFEISVLLIPTLGFIFYLFGGDRGLFLFILTIFSLLLMILCRLR